ncbi:MAG: ATP-binding cassette domain-containing protein, partial [Candidatus Omnitrophica bacterium]|nr:ATP-binding cassette domain-containing protein [Candidatus Omnitrophota bacterium]
SILLDGVDSASIGLESLKKQVGIALQNPFLKNDTVANNIFYGAENASSEDMFKAAALAQAHQFIINLPDKYNSLIGEMACRLSEGQKQRIAIARAIIKKPKILILDEAMSSIDSQLEHEITVHIKRIFVNSTIILVSHRLSAVKEMDLVYFMEGLSRIDIGTHQELAERNPKYKKLFARQMSND